MSTDVPLLNDYKKAFVRKRLLQTFLAGLRIPGVPWYAKIIQLVIFALPLAIIIPYIVIIANTSIYAPVIFGGIISLLAFFTLLLGKLFSWLHLKKSENEVHTYQPSPPVGVLTDEESTIKLHGIFSLKTWVYVMPGKRHWWNIPLHSVIAGLLALAGKVQ